MGKKLKPVPKDNKGLGKLPTQVRNKMGFMKKGGQVAGPKNYTKKGLGKGYQTLPYIIPEGKKGDAIRKMFMNRKTVIKKNKGGLVKGGTSAQMTGKEYKGTF